jgi:K+-sensing histidine kinase KdpD
MKHLLSKGTSYIWAALGTAAVTGALAPFHERINATTVALTLLLVVLFTATLWGSRPALLAAVLGVLGFNFFFLPPVLTFTIQDPQNWVALTAFLITAITVGQLSARAKHRAEEAEAGRREIEELYQKLRGAFENASQTEALRQSERLKSALLDAVTHDLRTPLTSIKASVTTLLDENVGSDERVSLGQEGRQELLEVINEESDRLNHFIEGLVELARIDAGEMNLRRRWGPVDEILSAALNRAEPLTRGHTIELSVERELPALRVDARAVAEVVYTLLDNATKYATQGTVIRLTARRAPGDMIEIDVEDQGRGIPLELRERVFDKFFRADGDSINGEARATGIGMGLAIARGIVEAHGGRIWIESGTGGQGTRVALTLPIGDEDLQELAGAQAAETGSLARPI